MPNDGRTSVTNTRALKNSDRVTYSEVQLQPKDSLDLVWDWIKGVFVPTPRPLSPLEQLLSPEGAKMEEGMFRMLREKVAKDRFGDTGNYEEYLRIRGMTYDELTEYLESQQK